MLPETVSNRARVAIIGVEGSGKTVLMSVIAHRFNGGSTGGVFFYPLDLKTMQYVDRTWNTLNLCQWPPSTPAGDWPDLQWQVSVSASDGNAAPICDLRFVDAAGQDLRLLFSKDNLDAVAGLPAHLQKVWNYCRTADIVVCLINLKDFYGEGNLDQKSENEQFITWALHQLSINHDPHRRVMLLFTQIDQYPKLLKEKGGLPGVAQEILPIAYRAHVATSRVSLHAVSAVNDVELAEDEAGNLRPVPKKGFGSKYLEEFVQKIVLTAATIVKARGEVRQSVNLQKPPNVTTQQSLSIQERLSSNLARQSENAEREWEEAGKLKDPRNVIGGWFFAIAAFSIINLLVEFLGGDWGMLLGLGITQVIGEFSLAVAGQLEPTGAFMLRTMAVLLSISVAAVFVVFGFLAKRGKLWAIIVGMLLYALDSLIFLRAHFWLGVGFHVYVLWVLSVGLRTQLQHNRITMPDTANV